MPDIHIHRPHQLGLPQARLAARRWADKARDKFDMECTYVEAPAPGDGGEAAAPDTLHFQRPGMQGTLQVAADGFELQAELGFLFSAFKERIEQELQAQFDKLLLQPAG
ncbi:polyhydroxyalkanoic acid system family protein [Paracidovorax wautersii]|uniref:Polyhydroxyalkanoate system protein n=1 Tax=Paracidovorax wautersii TaxID=1177982 RepID=A0ABU1I7I3_9BURK|nr:polyhydroxyalkanoic acid system family protein [Paracidovorax wautersii]MDR6213035.1 putative polyhydroxyalkanoate system protein [Paracidovorax wautersii]